MASQSFSGGGDILADGSRSPVEELARRLRASHGRLAVAESCTGGMLSAALTSAAGSSDYFLGGVVAYHNSAKTALLGVPESLIASEGAVSAAVALSMAEGARERFGAEVGVGITGIAGPGGGMLGKPVGTVWVALSLARISGPVRTSHCLNLPGDRRQVREAAVEQALRLLVELLA